MNIRPGHRKYCFFLDPLNLKQIIQAGNFNLILFSLFRSVNPKTIQHSIQFLR